MKIEVANQPPWGHVEQPAEPLEIPRPIPSGEAPGEILRRQARDLLDEIPAVELPSALAFLEFLRDRGASTLLRPAGERRQESPRGRGDDDDGRRRSEADDRLRVPVLRRWRVRATLLRYPSAAVFSASSAFSGIGGSQIQPSPPVSVSGAASRRRAPRDSR